MHKAQKIPHWSLDYAMKSSGEYVDYVLEHLAAIDPVKLSRFFGGLGISRNTVQFAMIMDNSLYFVVNADTRKKYQQAGMKAFSYLKKTGRIDVSKYYEVPEDILTEPDLLRLWAEEAIAIASAIKSKSKKP